MIARANATAFGLAASVWTHETRGLAFADRLECGAVAINQLSASDARLPFGGVKDSGMGRELGREGALAFVNVKTLRWTREDTREESDA
jgi:succinate-semialdehyde dehydrogenase/glutarate-semialdehyde dehydrogenase